MASLVRTERLGAVLVATLSRPPVNALNDALIAALHAVLDVAIDDKRVAALHLRSDQRVFSAGADLALIEACFATPAGPDAMTAVVRDMQRLYARLEAAPLLTLAEIETTALGGGLELALACDLRFCSPNAEFALQDTKWGFHACDGGLIRLPQVIGMGHAMEIVLSGERVNAEHAYRIGLVNRVWPQVELLARSMDYAQMLAQRSPLAQRFAKEVMKRAVGQPLDDALRMESRSVHDLGQTEDLAEGTTAFRERRDATFKGR